VVEHTVVRTNDYTKNISCSIFNPGQLNLDIRDLESPIKLRDNAPSSFKMKKFEAVGSKTMNNKEIKKRMDLMSQYSANDIIQKLEQKVSKGARSLHS